MTDQPITTTQATPQQGAIVSLANLPKNMTKAQLLNPGSGKKFDPIWRLVPGQPVDIANRQASSSFYLTRRVRNPNNAKERISEYSKGMGKRDPELAQIRVIPLGYTMTRDYTVYHQDSNTYEQLCHSDNFMTPDVRFAGEVIKGSNVIAHRCSEIRLKVNKRTGVAILDENGNQQYEAVKLCPFANFGAPLTEGGKNTKPKCDQVYTVFFAVHAPFADPTDPTKQVFKWVAAEYSMKVMQAQMGENLLSMFGQLEAQGVPLSTHPLQFDLTEYKLSNTIKSSCVTKLILSEEVDKSIITPEEFETVSTIVTDTIAARRKWSQFDPNEADSAPAVGNTTPATGEYKITHPSQDNTQPATTQQEIIINATSAPKQLATPPVAAPEQAKAQEPVEELLF